MALTDNLIYSYECNEASGDLIDAHAGLTLTDRNTVGVGTGIIGNARDFEYANTEYFDRASEAAFNVGDIDCCWDIWVNRESASGLPIPFAKDAGGGGQRSYLVYYSAGWQFQVTANGTSMTGITITAASTGVWYHLYLQHDSVNNKIGYRLDGGTLTEVAHSGGIFSGTTDFCIGNRTPHDFPYDGLIDMVRFWKRLLTTAEQDQLYNSGAGLAYSDFGGVAYTLACNSGSYVITGTAASLEIGYKLNCSSGSYIITGTATSLEIGYKLSCESDSYVITGTGTSLEIGRKVSANSGSYAITGTDVALRFGYTLTASPSSYVVTGTTTTFRYNKFLAAITGSYQITGINASLVYSAAPIEPEEEPEISYISLFTALADKWNNR